MECRQKRDGITIKIIIIIKKVRFMFIFIVYQRFNIEFYRFIRECHVSFLFKTFIVHI